MKPAQERYYGKNRETAIARASEWNKKNPERRREITEKSRQLHPKLYSFQPYTEYQRNWHLRNSYGISIKEYDEILLAQDGKCAVCGKEDSGTTFNGKQKRMYIDHDHKTGKVRGLLCRECNSALGFTHENPEILLKLMRYIGGEL